MVWIVQGVMLIGSASPDILHKQMFLRGEDKKPGWTVLSSLQLKGGSFVLLF